MLPWKKAEHDFEDFFLDAGKDVYVHRLPDTAVAKATGGKGGFIAAQPADYVVTLKGETFYAEVKSTIDEKTFHFSNIRKQQMAASRRIIRAGGKYLFFIKSLEWDRWYCLCASVLHNHPTKSMTWEQLKAYEYEN